MSHLDTPLPWQSHAQRLAKRITYPGSRWWRPLATIPRHLLVPRWWDDAGPHGGWVLVDGPSDAAAWLRAAYTDQTLVTQVGACHADRAHPGAHATGRPTSSSTLPSLVVAMYRHAQLPPDADILDVGTGSGYGAALLAAAFGDRHITSIDIDPYLIQAAAARLAALNLHPTLAVCDATGPLPGCYDRIVSMVAVRPVPASWLAALRPGGRLVTTLTGIRAIITATKTDEHSPMVAAGRVEWDRAAFMETRAGPAYPTPPTERLEAIRHADGEHIGRGRYPIVDVEQSWELRSLLDIEHPGTIHRFHIDGNTRTAYMLHLDGSWARAQATGTEPPLVHQSGPRRLWDALDDLRHRWLTDGQLPLYGAKVFISPAGTVHLTRGTWRATITAPPTPDQPARRPPTGR